MKAKEPENLVELLKNSARLFSDNIALSLGNESITYEELESSSERVASHLQSCGMGKGDHIAILAENRPEWGIAFFGITKIGAAAVCMDPLLKENEVEFILKDSGAACVFTSETFVQTLNNISGSLPNLKRIIQLDEIHSLEGGSFSAPVIDPDDTAILIYTSGTMGSQKGVMLSHRSIALDTAGMYERIPYKSGTTFLSLLPLSHMFGITVGFLAPLYNGARAAYSPGLKGYEILEAMEVAKPNIMVVVPLMLQIFYNMLNEKIQQLPPIIKGLVKVNFALCRFLRKIRLNAGKALFRKVHKTFGGHLKFFTCGGAPLDPEIEKYFYTLGLPVFIGYGLTEASPIVAANTPKERRVGSVGKPLPQVEVKISEEGEILVRGPIVMKGYHKNESATREVLRADWLCTGDIGEVDEDGYLYIRGREKNVIVTSSGLKIFPEEIETQVSKSPFIEEVCILGRKVGAEEQPYGVIYPDYSLLGDMRKEEIRARIRQELEEYQRDFPVYKKVSAFEIWDEELPKTTTRKIKRKLLADAIGRQEPGQIAAGEAEAMDPLASRIRSIVAGTINIPESAIKWESNLAADLGVGSLMKIEVLSALDKELGVYVPEEYSYRIETFEELVSTIRNYSESPEAIRTDFLLSDAELSHIIKESSLFRATRFISSVLILYISRFYFNLKVKHRERVPEKSPFIIAPNHTSLLDFPLIYISLPRHIMRDTAVPAAKDYFFRNPIISLLVQAVFRAFPLERYGNFFEGLKSCAKVIQSGKPLILFPEGTRSVEGTLQSFKPGIGLLALELNVPILPVYIKGAYDALPKGSLFPISRPVEIRFGVPIIPENFRELNDEAPSYEIYQRIIEELKKRILKLMKEE